MQFPCLHHAFVPHFLIAPFSSVLALSALREFYRGNAVGNALLKLPMVAEHVVHEESATQLLVGLLLTLEEALRLVLRSQSLQLKLLVSVGIFTYIGPREVRIVSVYKIALVLSEIQSEALEVAIAEIQGALAVEFTILPAAFVGRPVNESHLALTAALVVIPLALVLVSKAVHFLAKAVHDDLACVDSSISLNCDHVVRPSELLIGWHFEALAR